MAETIKDLPEMEVVTPEQEALVTELIETVIQPMKNDLTAPAWLSSLDDVDLRITAYKFLIARKWVMADATKMLVDTVAFKKSKRTDEKCYCPPPFQCRGYDYEDMNNRLGMAPRQPDELDRMNRQIAPFYQGVYHKVDKKGHPIFIERTGNVHVQKFVERLKALSKPGTPYWDGILEYHIHFNEFGSRLVKYHDLKAKEQGKRVLGVLVILDMAGLGYGHLWKPVLEVLKRVWDADKSYYPEGMHRVFIVNCPSMIMFAFAVVKGWLDARIQNKIIFVKPEHTAEVLLQAVDAENLPAYLGGKCQCEGGCVYTPLADDDNAEGHDDTLTEEIKIPAGKDVVREFELQPGEEVVWEFQTSSDHDIQFSVHFFPKDGAERAVVDANRVPDGADRFEADTVGTLKLKWDNTFSWVRSKKIAMRVMKM